MKDFFHSAKSEVRSGRTRLNAAVRCHNSSGEVSLERQWWSQGHAGLARLSFWFHFLCVGLFSKWCCERQRSASGSELFTLPKNSNAGSLLNHRETCCSAAGLYCTVPLTPTQFICSHSAFFMREGKIQADWMDEWLQISYHKRLKCAQRAFVSVFLLLCILLYSNAHDSHMFALSKWRAVTSEGTCHSHVSKEAFCTAWLMEAGVQLWITAFSCLL